MRPFTSIFLPVACMAADVSAQVPVSSTTTKGPPLWLQPDFFPILPWDPQHGWRPPHIDRKHGLASIAACQFTMGGFVQSKDLPECERLGLAAIMAPPGGHTDWRELSDEQIEQRVLEIIASGGDSPAVMGYYIMDEPGTPVFPALAKAVAAVKKYAPGKLAYINLYPGYATIGAPDTSQLGAASFTEYLERFVREVQPQILSYDNYMTLYSDDLQDRQRAAGYWRDLMEVRRVAIEHDLPFWNIVSSNQIRPQTTIPSPANLQFQAYTTLAAGGRGVTWFTYYAGTGRGYSYAPIDRDGERSTTWGYLQMVNAQVRTLGPIMNRLRSTGVFFTTPAPMDGLPHLPGRIVKDVQSVASPRGLSPMKLPLMVGEFEDQEGRDCVMLVNISVEGSANIQFTTQREYATRQVVSAADGRLAPWNEEHGLWLSAGQGALVRLD